MDGAQITGSASSYARKYALNGLFLIDDTKDSDATNTHDKETSKPTTVKPVNIVDQRLATVKSVTELEDKWMSLSATDKAKFKQNFDKRREALVLEAMNG